MTERVIRSAEPSRRRGPLTSMPRARTTPRPAVEGAGRATSRPGGAPVTWTPLARELHGAVVLAALLVVTSIMSGAVLGAWVGW